MGNATSGSVALDSAPGEGVHSSTATLNNSDHVVGVEYGYYKGKKYAPSQYQVDLSFDELKCVYDRIMDRWGGVDKELLTLGLLARIRAEHPELFSSPSAANATFPVDTTASSVTSTPAITTTNHKKMKVEIGPIIIHGLRVPKEVVAHILPYCRDDRTSINNFGATSRGIRETIHHDRRVVKAIPWPIHCPWPSSRWDHRSGKYFVVSSGASQFAVTRNRKRGDLLYGRCVHCEIWDRFHGMIGELEWRDPFHTAPMFKPVFSPDGKLLLVPQTVEDRGNWPVGGVQVVQLPPESDANEPIIVSANPFFPGAEYIFLESIAFVNLDTIVVVESDNDVDDVGVIHLWKINHVNGHMSLSFSRRILEDVQASIVASFIGETRTFLAILPWPSFLGGGDDPPRSTRNHIMIHDLTHNETSSKTLPVEGEILDLAFSKDGKLVAIFSHWPRHGDTDSGGVYLCDCKVNAVDEIGQPELIYSIEDGYYNQILSFSADETKVAVRFHPRGYSGNATTPTHIIDLQTKELLSNRFLNVEDWDQSGWNAFVN